MYSVNVSAYFPLFGRFLSGVSDISLAVLLGQIALQTGHKSRGSNFIVLEAVYCLGSAFGPGLGAFVTFKASILGWKIDEGNSPGIVLSIIWLLFLIFSLLLPKNIWVEPGASKEANTIATFSDDEDEMKSSKCRKPTERLVEDCSELKHIYYWQSDSDGQIYFPMVQMDPSDKRIFGRRSIFPMENK